MFRFKKWYEDPEFYKGLAQALISMLASLIDYLITLEIAIRYLQWRGIL